MRVTEAGVELDAEVDIDEIDGRPAFTMHSHSGASGGRPRRNPQYSDALRVILSRLGELRAVLTDALVVSSDALRDWPDAADRRLRLGIDFPVRVSDHDPGELRTALTEAMRAAARDPSLGPGGNNRRRVTFYLDMPGNPHLDELAAYLASGATVERPGRAARRTGPRRPAAGVPLVEGTCGRRRSRAQGYVADAAYRRAVELHAMQMAVEHFEADWDVEDTSAGNPYDLILQGSGRSRYVEVKGTAGLGERINLTANEVEHARRHGDRVMLFLVNEIDVDRSDPAHPKASGGSVRIVDPLDINAGELWPTAFTWTVPRHD